MCRIVRSLRWECADFFFVFAEFPLLAVDREARGTLRQVLSTRLRKASEIWRLWLRCPSQPTRWYHPPYSMTIPPVVHSHNTFRGNRLWLPNWFLPSWWIAKSIWQKSTFCACSSWQKSCISHLAKQSAKLRLVLARPRASNGESPILIHGLYLLRIGTFYNSFSISIIIQI